MTTTNRFELKSRLGNWGIDIWRALGLHEGRGAGRLGCAPELPPVADTVGGPPTIFVGRWP